jgi:hypothetical protein
MIYSASLEIFLEVPLEADLVVSEVLVVVEASAE